MDRCRCVAYGQWTRDELRSETFTKICTMMSVCGLMLALLGSEGFLDIQAEVACVVDNGTVLADLSGSRSLLSS